MSRKYASCPCGYPHYTYIYIEWTIVIVRVGRGDGSSEHDAQVRREKGNLITPSFMGFKASTVTRVLVEDGNSEHVAH